MAARSQSKAEAAINELKEETGKEAIWLELDLSSLASVRRGAETFLRYVDLLLWICFIPDSILCISKEKELHILFNNAWVKLVYF